jgi:transposase InsO family protein
MSTHVLDRVREQLRIHCLILPRHPQTNGTAERFNGHIGDIFNWTRFGSRAQLESTLRNTSEIYNHSIPQRALNHKHLSRHPKSRARNGLNCSGNACIPSRVLTGIQANMPKRSVP